MKQNGMMILPSNVKPIKYDLTLTPDLNTFRFTGHEYIDIDIINPTSSIVLNSLDLTIEECHLILADHTTRIPVNLEFDDSKETVTLNFSSSLSTGLVKLYISFTGELDDKLRGFYRSEYTNKDGQQSFLASTQFEATDARRAFPCWDEPAAKAKFAVRLNIQQELIAISNMPVSSTEVTPQNLKTVKFQDTPIMSTYLLAFIIGDLACVQKNSKNGTLMRVWTTKGNESQGNFALDTSIKMLDHFNRYFGIQYPLPKLDHIAIPDFAAGAMENWGAITYRETALLVDEENSSAGTKQIVATIIAHEMAHMWFGDLVTMTWWDDLWLNESFASWMGDKITNEVFPEWEMWTQFLTSDTNEGLTLDGLRNTHPIEQEVSNPSEIGELFDAISYSKGASILRMLEQFLGEEIFQCGLHDYLDSNAYANAKTRDLWDALGKASAEPVAQIMDTWTKQAGYPVIDVDITRESSIELSQRRFLYEQILEPNDQGNNELWQVPINIKREGEDGDKTSVLITGKTQTVCIPSSIPKTNWVKVNYLQTGFYRVHYSTEDLERLSIPIKNRSISAPDRIGIQNDAYALSRAGYIQGTQFLAIAKAYKGEDNASVCSDLAANLADIDSLLWDQPYYNDFTNYAKDIFHDTADSVGWAPKPEEGHLDSLLRNTVLAQLGKYGDDKTLAEAVTQFAMYTKDNSSVDPDIRRVVFNLAAKRGDGSTYEEIWNQQIQTDRQEEKLRLITALTNFSDIPLLEETLERSLSKHIRYQDAITVVALVARNRFGQDIAWEFLKENWKEYDRRYGDGGFAIMRLATIPSNFTTGEKFDDVSKFFSDNPVPAAHRSVLQSLEQIKLNIAWLKLNEESLSRWFST